MTTLTPYLYASPGYLEQFGEPRQPAGLQGHQCLRIPHLNTGQWVWHHGEKSVIAPASGRFKVNNISMIRRLATLDMGLILMPEQAVGRGACGRLTVWQGYACDTTSGRISTAGCATGWATLQA